MQEEQEMEMEASPSSSPKVNRNQNTERNENSIKDDNENELDDTKENTRPLENTLKLMTRLQEKVQDKETLQEVSQIRQNQQEAEGTIENSFDDMKARPSIVKFVFGPDYKNAGQVRSEVVKLQATIKQMTRLRDRLSVENQGVVDEAISTMNQELTSIQTKLSESLSGFSLLGWLNKLLSGFTVPVPEETPEVLPTPEDTQEPEVEQTLEPTAVPTEAPTTEPTI